MVRKLQFNQLSDPEGVIHLDAKVPDSAFELRVTEMIEEIAERLRERADGVIEAAYFARIDLCIALLGR